jgi:hypothetical protein
MGKQKGRRKEVSDAKDGLNDRSESVHTGQRDVRKRHHYRGDGYQDDDAAICNFVMPGVCRHARDYDGEIVTRSGTQVAKRILLHEALLGLETSAHNTSMPRKVA